MSTHASTQAHCTADPLALRLAREAFADCPVDGSGDIDDRVRYWNGLDDIRRQLRAAGYSDNVARTAILRAIRVLRAERAG